MATGTPTTTTMRTAMPMTMRMTITTTIMGTADAAKSITTTRITTTTDTTTAPTIMGTTTGEAAPAGASPLLTLMTWLSPAFPVGAFAYSHGLEWAAEAGDVRDAASLEEWLADVLAHGAGRNDAILLAVTHRAVTTADGTALAGAAELALALATSRERLLETVTQGNAFVLTVRKTWPTPALDLLRETWAGDVAYAVALGVAAAGHGLPLVQTLEAFLAAFAANLVSAAVRLGVVGQTDGQAVTAALLPHCRRIAAEAATAELDDIGGAAFRSDLASLRHETQYTRLFRS